MTNIIFAGVGGQGVLLASKVLMQVALDNGYQVKESEVHGMAQRGGSVDCHVRYGEKVYSPLIPKSSADFIVAFEYLEALRKLEYLSPNGKIIVNKLQINPAPVEAGLEHYPDGIDTWFEQNLENAILVDTKDTLKQIKSQKALNIVLLGLLSNFLEFDNNKWEKAIKSTVKEKFVEMNLKAFQLGKDLIKHQG